MNKNSDLWKGIGLMVLTWSLFAFMSAFAKAAYAYTNPKVTFFFQNFVGFLLVAALTVRPGFTLKSDRWPLLLARGLAGALSFFCLFYSISRIPLTDGTVLNTTAPLFLPLFLHFWLKKKSSLKVWLSSLLGFIGVVCILKPGAEILQPAALPALFSGIGSAFVMILIRLLAGEDAKKIVFVYLLIASLSIFPFAASSLPSLPAASWPYLIAIGLLFGSAQIAYTKSLAYAEPTLLAPFVYTFVVVSGCLEWLVWDRVPSLLSAFGMLLIILGGVLTILWGKGAPAPAELQNSPASNI